MAKVKFEIIRDYVDGSVDGYKLGKWYLMKHYYWGNSYEWIINDTGQNYFYGYESISEMPNTFLVHSCKEGKQKLIELNNAER